MPSPNIYFKLGPGITSWYNERFKTKLTEGGLKASFIAANNIDAETIEGLNAQQIVQISEEEYNTLVPGTNTTVAVNVDDILAAEFITGCPVPNSIFFVYQAGTFYKIYWKDVRDCIAQEPGLILDITFRVGKTGYPQPDDTSWQNDAFIDKTMRMYVNGIRLYSAEEWQNGDTSIPLGDIDYADFDISTGTFSRPAKFKKGELIEVKDERITSDIPTSLPT